MRIDNKIERLGLTNHKKIQEKKKDWIMVDAMHWNVDPNEMWSNYIYTDTATELMILTDLKSSKNLHLSFHKKDSK